MNTTKNIKTVLQTTIKPKAILFTDFDGIIATNMQIDAMGNCVSKALVPGCKEAIRILANYDIPVICISSSSSPSSKTITKAICTHLDIPVIFTEWNRKIETISDIMSSIETQTWYWVGDDFADGIISLFATKTYIKHGTRLCFGENNPIVRKCESNNVLLEAAQDIVMQMFENASKILGNSCINKIVIKNFLEQQFTFIENVNGYSVYKSKEWFNTSKYQGENRIIHVFVKNPNLFVQTAQNHLITNLHNNFIYKLLVIWIPKDFSLINTFYEDSKISIIHYDEQDS